MLIAYLSIGLVINAVIGAMIYDRYDVDNRLYNWYIRDPSYGLFSFFILNIWPIILVLILTRWRRR